MHDLGVQAQPLSCQRLFQVQLESAQKTESVARNSFGLTSENSLKLWWNCCNGTVVFTSKHPMHVYCLLRQNAAAFSQPIRRRCARLARTIPPPPGPCIGCYHAPLPA
jgi:hypothetical protein